MRRISLKLQTLRLGNLLLCDASSSDLKVKSCYICKIMRLSPTAVFALGAPLADYIASRYTLAHQHGQGLISPPECIYEGGEAVPLMKNVPMIQGPS